MHFDAAKAATPQRKLPDLFAYVYSFTLDTTVHPVTQFFKVNRKFAADSSQHTQFVKLEDIVQYCPLVPRFSTQATDLEVDNDSCIEKCNRFWVNTFHSGHTYKTVF
jgi:hypothetical protein